ncbi:hypothetical protein [Methylobacterium gnaphalii]|uniref:Uncharacterized protein n=1 Tax=Methylobacterium gnaphalii TaxID=1010610 RepID=A0A512JJP1_9HYPH|nr:hypothetical protein [Methylobacterium gnaphalii]GEP10176.1 hypothetical protein MGN01_20210 [Methylobacterium gnaphalii]GJD69516.1 hypothetical protein MMMDOFMJ_2447 [Methylobacterium gnaphalii]GLS48692.1 hypothetical protein GCM10007885_15360 [Methylobacterium gnaphalii]
MTTFHLKDGHWLWSRRQLWRRTRSTSDATTAVIFDWVLSTALCVGIAALLPVPTMHWVLAALLNLAGYAWLGVAIGKAGPPFGRDHLTAWDAALLSFATSFSVQAAAHFGVFNA